MAIRYDKKLRAEISQTVRNFNRKIYRLEKLERELVPSRTSVAQLKSQYTSRRELRRKLNELQRFSERGAEKVVQTAGGRLTAWELGTLKRETTRAKSLLTRRIKRLETTTPTVYGIKQARTYAQMGDEQLSNLRARRETLERRSAALRPIGTRQRTAGIEELRSSVEKTLNYLDRQNQTFYNSYFDILEKSGYMAGVDPEKIEHIKDALSKLKPDQFVRLTEVEKSFKALIDYYITQKMQAGVLDERDKDTLTTAFDELNNIIDDLVEQYQ